MWPKSTSLPSKAFVFPVEIPDFDVPSPDGMLLRTLLYLFLAGACAVKAGTSSFLLGADYSEWLPAGVTQIATDGSGAIYLLISFPTSPNTPPSTVIKLSADGSSIIWENQLGFAVTTMAVDPNGGVYVTPMNPPGPDHEVKVAKLNLNGTGVAWTVATGFSPPATPALAADAAGRVYVAGLASGQPLTGTLLRINASGAGIDYTETMAGSPTSIAVDASGAAFVAGFGGNGIFLERFAPDGSAGFFSSVTGQEGAPTVALDNNGEAVVYASGKIQRYDSTTGALIFSTTVSNWVSNYQGLLLDTAGNAYITGSSQSLCPVLNTLATCGSDMLSVVARDGSILQTTYIPGAPDSPGAPLVALGVNSRVLVVDTSSGSFTPSKTGPFSQTGTAGSNFLLQLAPNPSAATLPLACVGNAATWGAGPTAPGEIITLFGNGLGPEQGTPTQASPEHPFPTQAANVQVTFDGMPAPLLWVQDAQINAIAPWFLIPGTTTQICVVYNGIKTNCLGSKVVQTSPGVFMASGSSAAALNQDGTINSSDNPAAPGSIVSVFATGLGPINPPQPDGALVGLPLPLNVLSVGVETPSLIGNVGPANGSPVPLKVTYAGPAPFLVGGASQINFAAPSGTSVVLYLDVSSMRSQPFTVYAGR